MTKDINRIIENWQHENYISGNTLYEFNSCLGYDKYEISDIQKSWIVVHKDLIRVGTNTFKSLVFINKEVERMNKENAELLQKLNDNLNLKNQYFCATINHIKHE